MLYVFFWVIPRASEFYMPTFRNTLFHFYRRIGVLLPAYEGGTECSETSAYKIQTPGNYPEKDIQHVYPLGFVSPCIIIYSNKSTNQMHQSLRFIACRLNTAEHVSGVLAPIIRSLSTAVAASGFTFGEWWY